MLKVSALALLVLLLAIIVLRWKSDRPILQYLFLCRAPIICGLLLVTFPLIAYFAAPTLLGSLLILDQGKHVAMIALVAVVTGHMVIQTTELILQRAPERMEVMPLRADSPVGLSRRWIVFVSILLALPLGMGVVWASWSAIAWGGVLGLGLGLGLGTLVITVIYGIRNSKQWNKIKPLKSNEIREKIQTKTDEIFKKIPQMNQIFKGYGPPKLELSPYNKAQVEAAFYLHNNLRGHLQVIIPTFLLFGTFAIGWVVMKPPHVTLPALFFVVYLILQLGYVFAGMTFFLDKFRFPVLVFILWVSILFSFSSSRSRHYYELTAFKGQETVTHPVVAYQKKKMIPAIAQQKIAPSVDEQWRSLLRDSLEKRLEKQDGDRVLVAFASAGGGIQAAAWTAQVFAGLHEDEHFGPEFFNAIHLISSVSGGTVGSLFLLDRLQALQAATSEAQQAEIRQTIVDNAMANSLPSVAWSLAYQDAFRQSGLNWWLNRIGGRGWALEETFRERLMPSHRNATIRKQWYEAFKNGELPLPIFNGTLVESGDRFLMSPVDLPYSKRAQTFVGTYADFDMSVATAARLSATFPYVSPLASPWVKGLGEISPGWHVGDGGYFDNYGIFSLIEWLNEVVMPNAEALRIKRILIVQINAFPLEASLELASESLVTETLDEQKLGAWEAAVVGPALALSKVRVSTQKARNFTELEFLRAAWRHLDVKLCEFDIRYVLPDPQSQRSEPPLSWKLSSAEKKNIRQAWDHWLTSPDYQALEEAWKGTCPCEACMDDFVEQIKEDAARKGAKKLIPNP